MLLLVPLARAVAGAADSTSKQLSRTRASPDTTRILIRAPSRKPPTPDAIAIRRSIYPTVREDLGDFGQAIQPKQHRTKTYVVARAWRRCFGQDGMQRLSSRQIVVATFALALLACSESVSTSTPPTFASNKDANEEGVEHGRGQDGGSDLTSPDTVLTSTPAEVTRHPSAEFQFRSDQPGTRFECRVDSGALVSCASPTRVSGLLEGVHVFEVLAINELGLRDASPAVCRWQVDMTPPAAPNLRLFLTEPLTSRATPGFAGYAEHGSLIQIIDDETEGLLCSTIARNDVFICWPSTRVSDGFHRVTAYATDAAGNTSEASSPVEVTVDTEPPETTFLQTPGDPSAEVEATFRFSSPDPSAAFECTSDGGGYDDCTSPWIVRVGNGQHSFAVRAKDQVGNVDPTPAEFTWMVRAGPDWVPAHPTADYGAFVFDSAQQRLLLLEASAPSHLWQFDGSSWALVATSDARLPSGSFGVTFDAARSRIVLFGGARDLQPLNETWTFDGHQWQLEEPVHSPSPRSDMVVAYDAARQRVVMFGGRFYDTASDETWEWDGQDWTQMRPTQSPPARFDAAMAYDVASSRMILFGGYDGSARMADTWVWNGLDWAQLRVASPPPPRSAFRMVYEAHRNRVLFFGGFDYSGHQIAYDDTWSWTGSTWVAERTTQSPGRWDFAMGYDEARQRTVVFGGHTNLSVKGDVWEWNDVAWRRYAPSGRPEIDPRGLLYDTNRQVVLAVAVSSNQVDVVWEWNGQDRWTPIPSQHKPSARADYCLAYDSSRGVVVLFGGRAGSSVLNETWEWNGMDWNQRAPSVVPTPREFCAMAYDPGRRKIVVFGGQHFDSSIGTSAAMNDTWEWDGTNWAESHPADVPSERTDHALAYSPSRRRVVMVGERDTWEWDGVNWTGGAVAAAPFGRDGALAHDPARGRMVFVAPDSGVPGIPVRLRTWEWDGSTWTEMSTAHFGFLGSVSMAYDASRSTMVLHNGWNRTIWER